MADIEVEQFTDDIEIEDNEPEVRNLGVGYSAGRRRRVARQGRISAAACASDAGELRLRTV